MKTSARFILSVAALLSLISDDSFAAKIEEQIVGPVVEPLAGFPYSVYSVSPQGVHLATVVRKGSRLVINVDGVEGPRFEELVVGEFARVDIHNLAQNSRPKAVTFSQDGKHFAYIARQGQEWAVFLDHKEVLRIPAVPRSNTQIGLELTGPDGKHLLFTRSVYEGAELWVDGQKWPGYFRANTTETAPVVSPDGAHVAVVMALSRDKSTLIVDGKDMGYVPSSWQFTPDSKHIVSVAKGPKGATLLMDGKPLGTATDIADVMLPPVGNRMIAVVAHRNPDQSPGGYMLLVDGKPVPATLSPNASDFNRNSMMFSPDGKHYAAICGKPGSQYIVVDGKKGQDYASISQNTQASTVGPQFLFSPDSSRLVYIAQAAGKQFVVVNEDESDAIDPGFIGLRFSENGKHFAYWGGGFSGGGAKLFIDNKVAAKTDRSFQQFMFNPDGSRFAYQAALDQNGTYIDGAPTGVAALIGNDPYDYLFSPDGKHLAYAGTRQKDIQQGMWVDGELVTPAKNCRYCAFTSDSQHVYWVVSEFIGGGKHEYVVHLDGKPLMRTAAFTKFDEAVNVPRPGRLGVLSSCEVSTDGTLTYVGIVDDVIKRFTITPDAETSIATMLSTAKAGGTKTAQTPASSTAVAANQKVTPTAADSSSTAAAQPAPANGANRPQNAPPPPAADPVADAAKKATAKVDAAAAKAKSWLDTLTKKK